MKKIITKDAEETKEFAKKFAKTLKPGDILALVGDLGGGKTTFTKGLAKAFDIKEKIQSPSFTLIREYVISKKEKVKSKKNIRKIYHIDVYRLRSEKEVEELGFNELFQEKNAVFVIEWADRIRKIIPKRAKWIEFDFIDEGTRKILLR